MKAEHEVTLDRIDTIIEEMDMCKRKKTIQIVDIRN